MVLNFTSRISLLLYLGVFFFFFLFFTRRLARYFCLDIILHVVVYAKRESENFYDCAEARGTYRTCTRTYIIGNWRGHKKQKKSNTKSKKNKHAGPRKRRRCVLRIAVVMIMVVVIPTH